MSQPPPSHSQDCVFVCVFVCAWACVMENTVCKCKCMNVCMFVSTHDPHACVRAATCHCRCCLKPQRCLQWCAVRWPSVTFEDVLLVKDTALLWLIMMLCLSLVCFTSRSAIWHLHDISIYLWTSHLTPQCVQLVGMTPVRQRGRCHSGRVTQWRFEHRGRLRVGKQFAGCMVTCSAVF